jgi:hypothetical protein
MQRKYAAGLMALALVFGGVGCSDDEGGGGGGGGGGGDLAADMKKAANDAGEEISDEEAECAAEMLVALLGEEDAKAAASKGGSAIEEAMASFGESENANPEDLKRTVDALTDMSDECLEAMDMTREDIEALAGMMEMMGELEGGATEGGDAEGGDAEE